MKTTWRARLAQAVREYDLVLLGCMAILAMVGVLMIYSATTPLSDRLYGTSWILLRNHLLHLTVGLGALAIGMFVPYSHWKRWVPLALLICRAPPTWWRFRGCSTRGSGTRWAAPGAGCGWA